MSALSLALLAQLTLACPATAALPAGQAVERVAATAQAESRLQSTALFDNTTKQSYAPSTDAEAASLAAALRAQGHNLDAGVMQINDANWSRLGLTAETVFEPGRNVCAGIMVLAEAYATERRVSCRYNTGRPDCTNGYPERIEAALRRVHAERVSAAAIAVSVPRELSADPIPTDPFVGHGPVREMMFAPSFRPVALSQIGRRSVVPAAPENPTAAPERGRGELVTMRSAAP